MPVILLLFIGSGCAALIYEVVWFQLLQLAIGSSAVSLGILLGTFMGGMCLGSLVLPHWVGVRHHPLRVYALLELGIGLFGLAVLWLVPVLSKLYFSMADSGATSIGLRACMAGVCLIPPTVLMGATLPVIARWVEAKPGAVAWLGVFYGCNLAGAVLGSLLAGYYLLRVYDMEVATYVAVAINCVACLLAWVMARSNPFHMQLPARTSLSAQAPGRNAGPTVVYIAIGLSGCTALGSEVVWTRLLSLLLGGTAYTFSLILAVFLVGLGLGSGFGSALARDFKKPKLGLAVVQLATAICVAWGGYASSTSLPQWPVDPSIHSDLSINFQLDLVRAAFVVLPGAILWGASFPIALACVVDEGTSAASMVGKLYAANTTGAIVGAIGTSLILVGTLGSQFTQQALIVVAVLSAAILLVDELGRISHGRSTSVRSSIFVVALCGAAACFLMTIVPPLPGLLVAYGRYAATWINQSEIVYVGEGVTASVAVTRSRAGDLNYHNAGKVQASSEPQDMRLQRMLGHITTLVPAKPNKVLVIGCGAGVTAGAVSIDPLVEHETIAEIEPLVPKVVSRFFSQYNFGVVANPKVHVHLDDARHFLQTTNEQFDAVTSDPLDPWVKGAATLYTIEFFNEVKAHLKPGGVLTLFVQLYESTEEATKSEVATFFEAFPNGAVFANTASGLGYDLVLFGQKENNPIDVDAVQRRLNDPANAAIKGSLAEIGIHSAIELFATYAGQRADMQPWLEGAILNRDRNLKLQYLAGIGLNRYDNDAIYRSMTRFSRYPEDLFAGSQATLDELRLRINHALHR